MAVLLSTILLAQQLASAPIDTAAVAASSPRPGACAAVWVAPRVEFGIWERARSLDQLHFCSSLALGYASLRHRPEVALSAAKQAETHWPGKAAPLVLMARAQLSLGHFDAAEDAFERALLLDPHSLDAPSALRDRARAAVATGKLEVAAAAYRRLVPRVGLMPMGAARRTALIEAAVLAMHRGPKGLDEALGYLGEARRQPRVVGAEGYLLGALALVLDRQGRVQEARGVAVESGGSWGMATQTPLPSEGSPPQLTLSDAIPLLPLAERYAMVAVLLEGASTEVARDYWEACRQTMGEDDVWREHAERKLSTLGGSR